jgi:hypothetical protein
MENEITKTNSFAFKPSSITRSIFCSVLRKFEDKMLSQTAMERIFGYAVCDSKKIFQSMGSEYSLRKDLEASRNFLFCNQMYLKHSKNSFENQTQNQRNHVYFDFVKYLVVFFLSHSKRAFSVFLEYSFKLRFGLSTPKLSKNRYFFQHSKIW